MRPVVILAGGRGSRLAGVVADRPKALADIAGRPFLEWQFEYLAMQGIGHVVLSLGHLAQHIVDRYGERHGRLRISYAIEPAPLGTGGAIRLAFRMAGIESAFVLNGDTFMPLPLDSLAGDDGDEMVIALREVPDASRYGSVRCDGDRIVAFGEKTAGGRGLVNAGAYRIDRRLFDRWALPEAFSLEHDILGEHAREIRPRSVVVDAPFIDIGTPESYVAAQSRIPALLEGFRRHAARR